MGAVQDSYILCLHCPDLPGIVAAVACALRDNDCNIEEASQYNDTEGRFFMRVVYSSTSGKHDLPAFKKIFETTAQQFSMDWDITPVSMRPKVLIMVSKEDHCLHDILYRWRTNHLPIDITAIVSNHEDCYYLAESHGLKFVHLPVSVSNKAAQEAKLAHIVEETKTELIVLARYMQVLSADFCSKHAGRIINIHHSFLPGFKGAKPYHQAHERGVKLIGATAHFVTADLDEGPIIEQETARVDHTYNPGKLQALGRDIEAAVLSRALLSYTERRIFLHGHRTVIL